MREAYVLLNSRKKIEAFVQCISQQEGRFELVCGRQVIDAKSMLGIYTLDLSAPLLLRSDRETDIALLRPFMV